MQIIIWMGIVFLSSQVLFIDTKSSVHLHKHTHKHTYFQILNSLEASEHDFHCPGCFTVHSWYLYKKSHVRTQMYFITSFLPQSRIVSLKPNTTFVLCTLSFSFKKKGKILILRSVFFMWVASFNPINNESVD